MEIVAPLAVSALAIAAYTTFRGTPSPLWASLVLAAACLAGLWSAANAQSTPSVAISKLLSDRDVRHRQTRRVPRASVEHLSGAWCVGFPRCAMRPLIRRANVFHGALVIFCGGIAGIGAGTGAPLIFFFEEGAQGGKPDCDTPHTLKCFVFRANPKLGLEPGLQIPAANVGRSKKKRNHLFYFDTLRDGRHWFRRVSADLERPEIHHRIVGGFWSFERRARFLRRTLQRSLLAEDKSTPSS